MKTIKNLCVIVLLLTLLAGNCNNKDFFNGYDLRFKLKNNSNGSIFFSFNYSYPDTSIPQNRPSPDSKEYEAESKSTGRKYQIGRSWEKVIDDSPKDTFSMFVFSVDTINKLTWDTVYMYYKPQQRYDLSLKDLQNRNFEIEYPYDSKRGKLKVYTR